MYFNAGFILTVSINGQILKYRDGTKIGPFLDFPHFSIFLHEIISIASQLSCEAV